MSLYAVQAVLVLDNEGNRILAKYYSPSSPTAVKSPLVAAPVKEQKAFEKKLVQKTKGVNGDILLMDKHLVVYKQTADVLIYLVCPPEENEALVYQALVTLRDSVDAMLDHQVDKTFLVAHYDRLALVVDEIIDNGIILATEKRSIVARTTIEAEEEPSLQNLDIGEKGFKGVFDFAAGRLAQAVRQQLG